MRHGICKFALANSEFHFVRWELSAEQPFRCIANIDIGMVCAAQTGGHATVLAKAL